MGARSDSPVQNAKAGDGTLCKKRKTALEKQCLRTQNDAAPPMSSESVDLRNEHMEATVSVIQNDRIFKIKPAHINVYAH